MKKGKIIEETKQDITYESSQEGICPACGSEDIDWTESDFREYGITYEDACKGCGALIAEHYVFQFGCIQATINKEK